MSSLEIEEQVISEKHIPVDMEAYIKFKLGVQPPTVEDVEGRQLGEESAEQVYTFIHLFLLKQAGDSRVAEDVVLPCLLIYNLIL